MFTNEHKMEIDRRIGAASDTDIILLYVTQRNIWKASLKMVSLLDSRKRKIKDGKK